MKKILIYLFELVIAGVAMAIDMRLFWLYFFFVVMYLLDSKVDYLRKLIRVFQVANEAKIMAIAHKLEITSTDIEKVMEDTKEKVSDEDWKSLEKDFRDLR